MFIVLGRVSGTEVFGIGDQVDHWSVIPSGEGVCLQVGLQLNAEYMDFFLIGLTDEPLRNS